MAPSGVQLQLLLIDAPSLDAQVRDLLLHLLSRPVQPSARELLLELERQLGAKARWELLGVVETLLAEHPLSRAAAGYLQGLLDTGDLHSALRGEGAPDVDAISTIDALLMQSQAYRRSEAFQEMVDFMGRFRDYSPYNNMLVRLQNPACAFFATEKHWRLRFGARLKDDARPMLILAPMTPVILVYDLDQMDGVQRPEELDRFSKVTGDWKSSWLSTLARNAEQRDRIQVGFKLLSSTLSGFATLMQGGDGWKRRIVVHDGLDEASRFGVLCHELAHIYLGHLGADADHWWPSRTQLSRHAIEVEAEAVAHLVTSRFGLQGASSAYVSRHLPEGQVPEGVSMDQIAKVASRIEQMAQREMPKRSPRAPRRAKT